MRPFRIGIDSYCLNPLRLSPFEVLDWVKDRGGEGVQFSEVHLDKGGSLEDRGFLEELARRARDAGLYLEWGGGRHIPYDMESWQPKDLFDINRAAAEQAAILGAGVIRSCSGGLMRWNKASPPTEILLMEVAGTLEALRPMLADHGVTLAVELHFEFTTFELLKVFDMCGAEPGGPIGICLDTMNLLTMLEDPALGTARILPWVVATHIKDGGVLLDEKGLTSFTAAAGTGQIDFQAILEQLDSLDRTVNLSIEDHGGSFHIPIFDPDFLPRFPDLTAAELSRLVHMALDGNRRVEKGDLSPLDRSLWPEVCEERTANGLKTIKKMV